MMERNRQLLSYNQITLYPYYYYEMINIKMLFRIRHLVKFP